jgi:hypothetical protein
VFHVYFTVSVLFRQAPGMVNGFLGFDRQSVKLHGKNTPEMNVINFNPYCTAYPACRIWAAPAMLCSQV